MFCVNSYGYFEAWLHWLDGQSLQSACLGDWSILWLARSGKIASAIAGTVIVIDILGEERMRAFGAKVLGRYGDWEYKIATFGAAASLVLLATIFTAIWRTFSNFMTEADAGNTAGPQILLFSTAPLVGLIALTFGLAGFVISSLFFLLLLSHVLAMPKVGTILRTISLVLFCGGFHFDLLAS